MNEAELKKIIEEKCTNDSGKLKLTCPDAFAIAEEHGLKLLDITRVCNRNKIKIHKCQLGCFK